LPPASKLAVYPLRIIYRSPIPDGFVPKVSGSKAKGGLYPDEDRRLMACKAIPLCYRLLWGFLAREGMRSGEAITLAMQDLDLKRGAVRLDRNKTSDPRAWALSPGVARALSKNVDAERRKRRDLRWLGESGRQTGTDRSGHAWTWVDTRTGKPWARATRQSGSSS